MLAFPDSITASTEIDNSTNNGAGLQPQLQADTQGRCILRLWLAKP